MYDTRKQTRAAQQFHPTEPNTLSLLGEPYTRSAAIQVGFDFVLFVFRMIVFRFILVYLACVHVCGLFGAVHLRRSTQCRHRHEKAAYTVTTTKQSQISRESMQHALICAVSYAFRRSSVQSSRTIDTTNSLVEVRCRQESPRMLYK